MLTDHHSFSSNFSIKYYNRGTTTAFVLVSTKNPKTRMRTTIIVVGIVIGVSPAVTLRKGLAVMVRTLASALLVLVKKLASVPGNIVTLMVVMVTIMVHHPMRVKITTRPITRTTPKIMIGRMETSTPRMKIALKILI